MSLATANAWRDGRGYMWVLRARARSGRRWMGGVGGGGSAGVSGGGRGWFWWCWTRRRWRRGRAPPDVLDQLRIEQPAIMQIGDYLYGTRIKAIFTIQLS